MGAAFPGELFTLTFDLTRTSYIFVSDCTLRMLPSTVPATDTFMFFFPAI